jgi:5-methylcytosine-specific restriction endonuclease McrA
MSRKTPVQLICRQCQSPFEDRHYKPSRPTLYCSRACSHLAQTTRVQLTCKQCQSQFERKAYMQEWSQDRGPFCSFDCYGQWQKENTHGQANPSYKPQSPRRGAGQWDRNRKAALARDGYRCQKCGSTSRLHVHHQTPWSDGQTDPHALDNLLTLCASCHRKEHPMPHGPDGTFQTFR